MFSFVKGAELMLTLTQYLGQPVEVHVDFGLITHVCGIVPGPEIEAMKLEEVDDLMLGEKHEPLTIGHLEGLLEHMEMLRSHEVFYCGRSFFLEGFDISENKDSAGNLRYVKVRLRWGS